MYIPKKVFVLIAVIWCCWATSCSETPVTEDPCIFINCNDGTCIDSACDCGAYFSGTNCETVVVPTQMTAQSVLLSYIPNPCTFWDGGSTLDDLRYGPDVYIKFLEEGNEIYNSVAAQHENTNCASGCQYFIPITFDPNKVYTLEVYDSDVLTNELMGSFNFIPSQTMMNNLILDGAPRLHDLLIFEQEQSCSVTDLNYSSSIALRVFLHGVTYSYE